MAIEVGINQQDITYAKKFLEQYLSDQIPTTDFSSGTSVHDLVIKAISYIFAFLRSEISKVEILRSLVKLQELDTSEEKTEAINDIISNFFISRGVGTKSQVGITLVLSQRIDLIVSTGIRFNRDDTHYFVAMENTSIAKEDLIEIITPEGKTTYEYDMTLESEGVGEDYNVDPGNFVSWDNFNPYIINVRNNQKAVSGLYEESDDSYIARSKDAITVRNRINPKSTKTVLLEEFKSIGLKDVMAIGYGDPEMLRDSVNTYVTFDKIELVHIGNHQDVYVSLPLVEDQIFIGTTYTESKLGEPDRPGALLLPEVPIYRIHSVVDALTDEVLLYTLFVRDHRLTFTKKQENFIVLNSGIDGKQIKVLYDTVSGFDLIHNYCTDPEERIILANDLVRAKIPIYVSVSFYYTQISGQPDLNVPNAISTVLTFIDSVPSNSFLNVDSLIKAVHEKYSSQIIIKTPLILKGSVTYPDGSVQDFYSENILTVPTFSALGVTNRVCSYFSSSKYITFTKV